MSLSSAGAGGGPLDDVNFTRIMLKLKIITIGWYLMKITLILLRLKIIIVSSPKIILKLDIITLGWTWYRRLAYKIMTKSESRIDLDEKNFSLDHSKYFRQPEQLFRYMWHRIIVTWLINWNFFLILSLKTPSQWTASIRATLCKLKQSLIKRS